MAFQKVSWVYWISFLVVFTNSFLSSFGYICDVPQEWFQDINGTKAHNSNNSLWINGIVKYRFHPSLSKEDRVEVWKAFEEYHSKTCIRFQPWRKGDPDYTEIMVDSEVCGRAEICRKGGYQFTKFGNDCRSMAVMIHELGHTLCLYHEQQRPDRDDFLDFGNCDEDEIFPIAQFSDELSSAIYDYGSQMHYQCKTCLGGWPSTSGVTKCGIDITPGLSVIDADNINRLYNCQGCYRHRWRPIENLTPDDVNNMYNFGYKSSYGYIYPCRGLVNGEISVGKYSVRSKVCTVSHQGLEYELERGAEVLTIPGGRNQHGATYRLINQRHVKFPENVIEAAVFAGRKSEDEGAGPTFIAFATLKTGLLGTEDSIGMVGLQKGQFQNAIVTINKKVVTVENYLILVCS
ncbi:Zinc metalloproteinase nas-7 [Orchesella cincta]|uniref:Metalloendopeptidase n=1 Tax=Orchesella cincta TaxID=48709 RepID=A0A1D2M8Z2_ORCCI|nr:Zinc metalloproteinase nas-7 [Orchesella cincta]